MRRFLTIILLAVFSLFLKPPLLIAGDELYVLCAMGFRGALLEIVKSYEQETGIKVYASFSSSGKLAAQLKFGAPCDLFISASTYWVKQLVKEKKAISYYPFVSTDLVLVTYKDHAPFKINDLCKLDRVAIGNYRFAPFGRYALTAVKKLGFYNCLKSKIVLANHVAQAVMWVVTKNVDAAIIYFSDYIKFRDKLRLVYVFPARLYGGVVFAVVYFSERGRNLLNYIKRHTNILEKWGFELISR